MYSIHAYWCNEIRLRMYVGKPQSNPWNRQCTQIFTLAPNRYVFYNGSVSLVEERPRYLVNLLQSLAFVPILYYYQTIHVTRYSISFMYSLSDHNLRICLNVKVRLFLLYLRCFFCLIVMNLDRHEKTFQQLNVSISSSSSEFAHTVF